MISARFRVAFGLVSISMSLLMVAAVLGILPDENSAIRAGRAKLCEAIAIQGSTLANRFEYDVLEQALSAIVERNDDLQSAAVRRYRDGSRQDGEVVAEIGEHLVKWDERVGDRSNDVQVQVPISAGGKAWGAIELRFRPIEYEGILGVFLGSLTRTLVFMSSASFLVFAIFLHKVLQKLDPSGAVPQHVRSALDTLQEGLLVLDRRSRILLSNRAFAAMLGKNADRLTGLDVGTLPWQSHEGNALPWSMAMDAEKPVANQVVRLQLESGEQRVFMANSSPVLGHDGTYRGVLVSFDDVTQLEHQKVELVNSKAAADAANKAKSEFLANMSHEIRTPMNAILGYTDVLRRGIGKKEDRRKYLDTIHSSGQHLVELINDILDLSKIEAGRLELETAPCSPCAMVSDLVAMMAIRAQEKGISLSHEVLGKIPETIFTDPVRFRQCLTNLIGNAIKFTEQGAVTVISELRVRAGKTLFAVSVRDTGIGMDALTQTKIFDPFVQADSSITRRFGGTGLGLSITKRFSEALGGSLSVQSEVGVGTTFTLTLDPGPLDGVPLIDASSVTTASKAIESTTFARLELPPCHVLVVDDGEENRGLIRLVLEEAGATIYEAENGAEAIRFAQQHPCDLILMDMQMPIMDGYTAARELRKRGDVTPIIALTANVMRDDMQRCFAAGCSDFVAKPVDIDMLLEVVAKHLGGNLASVVLRQIESEQLHDAPATAELIVEGRATDSHLAEECHTARVPIDTHVDGPPIVSSLPTHKPQFAALVERFIVRLEEQLEVMDAAAAADDLEELARLAHWLKGSGGNVGFTEFVNPAKELESAAKASKRPEVVRKLEEIRGMSRRLERPVTTISM